MNALTVVKLLEELPGFLDEEYELPDGADVSLDRYVYVLHAVRVCRRRLSDFEAKVSDDLVARAAEHTFTVDGLGEVQIRKRTRRTHWDNEGLTRKLVAMSRDERILNEMTGEYEPEAEAVARVLSECARPSWRLTPLRERHIPIDEYAHEEDAGYTVRIG